MENSSNSARSQSAAILLGKALCNLFPGVQLIKGEGYGDEFYYEFHMPKPITSELLPVIQEEMLRMIHLGESFYPLEMVSKNAIELFKHLKQPLKVDLLKEEDRAIISLTRLDQHYDLVEQECQEVFEGTLKLSHLILNEMELSQGPYPTIQIFGITGKDKQKLKKIAQKKKQQSKVQHQLLGPQMNLFNFEQGQCIFLPKGQKALSQLKKNMNEIFEEFNFQEISMPFSLNDTFKKFLERQDLSSPLKRTMCWNQNFHLETNPFYKGLLNLKEGTQNKFKIHCLSSEVLEECIYCLKFYLKIIKILGFSYEVEFDCKIWSSLVSKALDECGLNGRNIQIKANEVITFRLQDNWGRNLMNLDLKIEGSTKGRVLLTGSTTQSLEKLLAWIMEENMGKLPREICPEEVHILSLKGGEAFVDEVHQYFKENKLHVTLDATEESLKIKLHKALLKKSTSIVIVGEKEQAEKKLTLRKATGKGQRMLTKEELLEELKTSRT